MQGGWMQEEWMQEEWLEGADSLCLWSRWPQGRTELRSSSYSSARQALRKTQNRGGGGGMGCTEDRGCGGGLHWPVQKEDSTPQKRQTLFPVLLSKC
jgi:hypothetical protein